MAKLDEGAGGLSLHETALLASMTAFGRASAQFAQGSLAWEIKSVNGKGLDLRLRLPPGFDALEAPIRGRVSAGVTRGSIQASLTLQRVASPPRVRIDPTVLRSLIEAIAAALPPDSGIGPLTLDGLLNVRGVVEVVEAPDPRGDDEELATLVLRGFDEALADLRNMRRLEGDALGRLLLAGLQRIGGFVEAAERAAGRTVAAIRERLERSVALLTDQTPPLDPQRLHQEAVMLATRADVREELDRLQIHIKGAEALLRTGGPVGRRLDFLAQELAREANTLCAKSNDAALTAIGLDLRNQIEQFREQVQNLE
jgi:uncharacterized protein (TIGR00255 family)